MHNWLQHHLIEGLGLVLTVLQFVGTAIAAGGIVGALVVGAIVLGAGILISALSQKKPQTATTNPFAGQQTVDPNAFRKFVFGNTALGNDVRFWEVYGNNNSYDQVICAATHKINSFGNLYVEGNLVPFSGNAATGTYAGSLSRYTSLKGVTLTNTLGATVGSGSAYVAASASTGMAHYLLKWVYDQKKLPNGIPTRTCQVGEGCPVYDPRRDTTVGGSGSHRSNDNTTWDYAATDSNGQPIGRNNALQMLTYLLGWTITNPTTGFKYLVFGRGVDPNDLDFNSWIAAANTCEVEQYYTDYLGSTGNTHNQNENDLAAGAQGVLLDNGGLWSYFPATDDTASIAVAFDENDIVGAVSWDPKASISQQFNQVGGNFVDPSATSLYQPMPYPDIEDATYLSQDNNVPKKQTLDFTSVTSPSLAQKLARIYLNRSRLTGQFKATFTRKALKAVNFNCVTLTFSPFGWTNKLFRINGISINPQGGVDLILNEENASVYTGGTINSYATPGTGTPYDERNAISLSGMTVSSVAYGSAVAVKDQLFIQWTAVSQQVAYVEVYIRPHGWGDWTLAAKALPDQSSVVTGHLVSGGLYDVEARCVSIVGVPGPYSSVTGFTVGSNEVARAIVGQGTGATTNVGTVATLNSIATGNIDANGVTQGGTGFNAGPANTGGALGLLCGVTETFYGGDVDVLATYNISGATSSQEASTLYIYRDGTLIFACNVAESIFEAGLWAYRNNSCVGAIIDNPGPGSHTYYLYEVSTGNCNTCYIQAVERKR